jgi:diacylglycerol kinase family enzyme
MAMIKKIIIIYNPNSTGDGKTNAENLQKEIAAVSKIAVSLQPTDFAGHAEKIAQKLSTTGHIMVISSSGDGGYHEIVNGILSHGKDADKIIAGLLPSGNANDHYHAVHHKNLVARIIHSDARSVDVLKVTIGEWTRYAHSYVGIGLTPHIGEKLTQAKLNPFNEVWLTIRYYFSLRPVKIRTDKGVRRYDSLIFSNIERMSKYMTLSTAAKIDDGKFEITGSRAGKIGRLTKHLFKASTSGLTDEAEHATHYTFVSMRPLALQLDGEVFHFDAGSKVTISIVPKALNCII